MPAALHELVSLEPIVAPLLSVPPAYPVPPRAFVAVRNALNLAAACCVDSQCLKRREWDEDESTELDVPRGEGEFPCREPCSLVVAAARQWAILENEEPRTYELELTPSERGQIESLIEAVADGRIDEIREADVGDGANRYRARYLRAKRFADGGFEAIREKE